MPSTTFVISEVYGGAGGGVQNGSTYKNDYIVLHNNSTETLSIDGHALQYASASGASWQVIALSGSVRPGGYYLIALGRGSNGTSEIPTPDASGSIAVSATAGKFALTSTTTPLSGANPSSSSIVDFVGFGATASAREGGGNTPAPSTFTSVARLNSGTQDTDDNANDFVAGDPNPRNSASEAYVACFSSDTRIGTTRGNIAVEDLTVGDIALTASGHPRAIRWLGHRTMACNGRVDRMPVRIAAGAFGADKPARDLLVSPAHAICVDLLGEVLIPACRLVNGSTITQVEMDAVTYWHVELDSHDILLAEGLPAESYLDMGNRGFFVEADTVDLTLGPDAQASRTTADFCRPFHEDGPLVDLVRARLRDRAEAAGWTLAEMPWADLHLVADGAVIQPDIDGLTARFVLPAQAREVRLVSHVSAPAHVTAGATDLRRLGVSLRSLTIDDGLTDARAIALDDARLGDGFHPVERNAAGALWRWTDGSALLPSALWDGCRGTVFLRLTLTQVAVPRWVAPGESIAMIDRAAFGQRARAL